MSDFQFNHWPTEDRERAITQHFGERPLVYARFGLPGHEGLDFRAPQGSKVYCVAAGTVHAVHADLARPYGINVRVNHAGGYQTIYAHLQEARVEVGQKVRTGQILGLAGTTGNVEGEHLHLTLKRAGESAPGYPHNIVDPTPFVAPLLAPDRPDARFAGETVPDGTVLPPGQDFTKTWQLRNIGGRPWNGGDILVHIEGHPLWAPQQVPLPPAPQDATVPVSAPCRAPAEPGLYRSTWQPADGEGRFFGPRIWAEIRVPEPLPAELPDDGLFIQRRGREILRHGRPFRFVGVNLRGLFHYGRQVGEPLQFSRLEHRTSQLRSAYGMGARVVRCFLADKDATIDEIEQRLGEVLDLVKADFPDLYLLPVFTNLYNDVPFFVPGDGKYFAGIHGRDLLNRDFFAGGYREHYLPLVERIVTAFRHEPNIFAWEIGNELKLDRGDLGNPGDPNPHLFIAFNLAVAAAIKRLDPRHMVTTGMKGTHHAWLHTPEQQEALYASDNIDFITVHSYEGMGDREGDLRVYDDTGVAARLGKPLVVEEAGFDRRIFADRLPKYQEHLDRWLGQGAAGYMPWGFIHAQEIGDGDNHVGVGANLDDFDALYGLFRDYAGRLQPVPVESLHGLESLAGSAVLERSLAGFNFRLYNRIYLNNPGAGPINDAAGYGAQVMPAQVPAGAPCWKVIGVHHLTPEENQGRHNVFVDILDEQGQRPQGLPLRLVWGWEGQRPDEPSPPGSFDKGSDEPATNLVLSSGQRLWLRVAEDGVPSETVSNLHSGHPDEVGPEGQIWNSFGHHSFYVVFRRTQQATAPSEDRAVPVSTSPDGTAAPVHRPAIAAGRVPVAQKLGIDANAPIGADGAIAERLDNRHLFAAMGVGWVRLNFILGPWHGPDDTTLHQGRTWFQTYRTIVDNLEAQNVRIYGLIGHEAIGDPGDQFRTPAPGGDAPSPWIDRYADRFADIARLFRRDVEIFETFNEPDDWHGAGVDRPEDQRNWMHPTWFAILLQRIRDRMRGEEALRDLPIVSGPLQGLDNNGNAGARYLERTYEAGRGFYGWGESRPIPFDGVGYHLYIAQGAQAEADAAAAIRAEYGRYIGEVKAVIRRQEGGSRPIYLSEIGWTSNGGQDSFQVAALRCGLDLVLQDPDVALAIWFCTQDFSDARGDQFFGLYPKAGLAERKPVYQAFQACCTASDLVPVPAGVAPAMDILTEARWPGVVTATVLNLRIGPGVDHAKIGTLSQDTQLDVTGRIGDWLRVMAGSQEGFVHRDFVSRRAEAGPAAPRSAATDIVQVTWQRYRDLIIARSERLGIDPAVAVAVLVAESGGQAFGPDGRPIIRFENHIFFDQWGRENPERFAHHFRFDPDTLWQAHQWRPDPSAPWMPCHTDQGQEWDVLDFARSLDDAAALRSTSMGAPQIMGFNHQALGYATVQAMFEAFATGEEAQISGLFDFVQSRPGAVDALRQEKFRDFAVAYNGPGQADHYARIIQEHLDTFFSLFLAVSEPLLETDLETVAEPLFESAEAVQPWGLTRALAQVDPLLYETWREHVRRGFEQDRGLLNVWLGVLYNSYWCRIAAVSQGPAAQQEIADATRAFVEDMERLLDRGADR